MQYVSPRVRVYLGRAAVAGLGLLLLILTDQASHAAEVSTVWKSTPRPLRSDKPGKLPRTQLWFNLENAEIAPGHVADVLQATIGGFPSDSDAVLVHVMTWNGATPEPAHQHWSLLDAHMRALPMSTLRSLRRISLLYVAYRHPAHMPVVYTLHEENPTATGAHEFIDPAVTDTAASNLVWGEHKFTLAPNETRVSFLLERSGPLSDSPIANLDSKHFRTGSYKYETDPAPSHYSLDFYSRNLQQPGGGSASHLPTWLSTPIHAANLGGDYSTSSTVGLLQAGDGAAYQPVYTLWMTAGFGPPNARVYGGLVTQTMMVFHDNINNMNWGTSYGAGAGVHLEWENKK